MSIQTTTRGTTETDEGSSTTVERLMKARPHLSTKVSPGALEFTCVTPPSAFNVLALYKDNQRRLYRPRLALTENVNRRSTDIYRSEKYIFFDVYLIPENKASKFDGKIKEKGRPLYGGEKLRLETRIKLLRDEETVKSFDCRVLDATWGKFSIFFTEEDERGEERTKENSSVGCIKVAVMGTFSRSLIIDNKLKLEKFKNAIPP